MTREEKIEVVARELDKPSVYMGGASLGSRRKATKIIERLEALDEPVRVTDDQQRTLDALRGAWAAAPHLRLCQLIVNATGRTDPFYVEDAALEAALGGGDPEPSWSPTGRKDTGHHPPRYEWERGGERVWTDEPDGPDTWRSDAEADALVAAIHDDPVPAAARDCVHGKLARSCETCELYRSVMILRARVERLEKVAEAANTAIEAADWLVQCERDVARHKPVRGLDEARSGWEIALKRYRALRDLEGEQ